MKTKRMIGYALALVAVSISANSSWAGQEGHGGQTVVVDGQTRLRDLVDTGSCVPESGNRFAQRLTALPAIMDSIQRVHWYLAASLKHQASQLRFCALGTALPHINTANQDADGMTIYNVRTRQVAIRVQNDVYVDMSPQGFLSLNETDRAFLFLHEVAHSYLPAEIENRNRRIQNFIRTLEDNYLRPMTSEDFAIPLQSTIDFSPVRTAELDSIRPVIEKLITLYEVDRPLTCDSPQTTAFFNEIQPAIAGADALHSFEQATLSEIQSVDMRACAEQRLQNGDSNEFLNLVRLGAQVSYDSAVLSMMQQRHCGEAHAIALAEFQSSNRPQLHAATDRYLRAAINSDCGDVIMLLLNGYRAQNDILSRYANHNLLFLAARHNSPSAASALVLMSYPPNGHCDQNDRNCQIPLLEAIDSGNPALVRALLRHPQLDVNTHREDYELATPNSYFDWLPGNNYRTGVFVWSRGPFRIRQLAYTKQYYTPLMRAISKQNQQIISLLENDDRTLKTVRIETSRHDRGTGDWEFTEITASVREWAERAGYRYTPGQ